MMGTLLHDRAFQPDEAALRELLVGRRIVAADGQRLTLDDGTVLDVWGNEGCGGCSSGWWELTELGACDAAIMNVKIEWSGDEDDEDDYEQVIRVFVYAADGRVPVASFKGGPGNGYYGNGWWLQVGGREYRN